ncbi:DUF86 domain-containing protein [Isoptericola variabilis]|nr:DUF86 domain-containing protein [Isoptericola variabilis]
MSPAQRSPRWHVQRSLDHVARLRAHLDRGLDLDDPLLHDAVSMQLIAAIDALIAANSVEDGVVAAAFGDAWRRMVGMRNIFVHEYVIVDVDLLHSAATTELDSLEEHARRLLDMLGSHE